MKPFEYLEASTVAEACCLLAERKSKARLIGGGTDVFLSLHAR